MTLILAGIQVIRDNAFVEETFEWPSKERLYYLIDKYQKSNVVFLTGDVHYGNRYQTPCEALTGYTLAEFCSSGMTHTTKTWGSTLVPGTVRWHQDPLYAAD